MATGTHLQIAESIANLSLLNELPDKDVLLFFQVPPFGAQFRRLAPEIRCKVWKLLRPRDIHADICTANFAVYPRQRSIPTTYHINKEARSLTRPSYCGKYSLDIGARFGGFDPDVDTLCLDDVQLADNHATGWGLRLPVKPDEFDDRPMLKLADSAFYYKLHNILLRSTTGDRLIGFRNVRHLRVEQHGPYQRPSVPPLNDKGQPPFSFLGLFNGLETYTERLHFGSDGGEKEYKERIEGFFKAFKMLEREALAVIEDQKGNEERARDIRARAIVIPKVYFGLPIKGTIRF